MSFLIENGILKKYKNDDNVTDVIVPDGVTEIGKGVFQSSDNIVSVTLPDSVSIIGDYAFYKCRNLATVIMPESIIRIGAYAFYKCRKLSGINTLGKITRIFGFTFYGCSNLTSVTIPEGVTHIEDYAFQYCKHLASVKLPDSLEEIGNMAFASCENLADFSMPPKVSKIGRYAFVRCKRLFKITLPRTLKVIEEGLLASCEGLTEIIIPEGVELIKNSAFNSCVNLSEVTIPPNLFRVEPFAFFNCYNLRKVTVAKFMPYIMNNAFLQCSNVVTNIPIRCWDKFWGIERLDYALHYMRNFKAGEPFFEDTKEENKRYIKSQLHNILKKDTNAVNLKKDPFGIRPDDTNMVIFLVDEIPLNINEVEALLDRVQGNPEASAILLDYRKRNFTEKFLEKYENDKLQKELGLKERTVEEWKKIFRLGDDGNGGYIILGSKGKDTSIEIPEKIGKRPVTAIRDLAFSPLAPRITQELRNIRNSLETVIIPDSITAIGLNAFAGCVRLNSIVYRGKTFTPDEFENYLTQYSKADSTKG